SDALHALNAVDIEPVLLKGASSWASGSGPGDRLIGDIDILIRPAEIEPALASLHTVGFAILQDERATSRHDVVVLGRPPDVGSIDLHQHAPGSDGQPPANDFYKHARRVCIAGAKAIVLSPEAQVYVMIMHDQIHDAHYWKGGYNLRHLLDIATLCTQALDW